MSHLHMDIDNSSNVLFAHPNRKHLTGTGEDMVLLRSAQAEQGILSLHPRLLMPRSSIEKVWRKLCSFFKYLVLWS